MAITLSSTFTDVLLEHSGTSVADQIGAGTLNIYSGTPPAGPNEALSGNTLLVSWTFSAGSAQGSPAAGSMTLSFSATTVSASNTGTATFFRILSSAPAALIQGTVATAGGDFNLTSTSITASSNVSITGTPSISWTVT